MSPAVLFPLMTKFMTLLLCLRHVDGWRYNGKREKGNGLLSGECVIALTQYKSQFAVCAYLFW